MTQSTYIGEATPAMLTSLICEYFTPINYEEERVWMKCMSLALQKIGVKSAFPAPAFTKNAQESNVCQRVVQTSGMDQQWQRVSSKHRPWFSWVSVCKKKNAVHFGLDVV
jgi:hypothetical protein